MYLQVYLVLQKELSLPREQVQCAVFVAELASVQVSLTMETFQACSKQTLASNLLQSRANSPKVST